MTFDEIEQHYRVNVDLIDESGQLVVYRYVEGTCIKVEFPNMNPPTEHVEAAAKAIAELAEKLT